MLTKVVCLTAVELWKFRLPFLIYWTFDIRPQRHALELPVLTGNDRICKTSASADVEQTSPAHAAATMLSSAYRSGSHAMVLDISRALICADFRNNHFPGRIRRRLHAELEAFVQRHLTDTHCVMNHSNLRFFKSRLCPLKMTFSHEKCSRASQLV